MKRREFVKNSVAFAGGIMLTPSLALKDKSSLTKLTILHTNDTHSHIDPFPANHAKFPNRGGVVWRHDLIQKIRSEEEHVLLLDAGDHFQGTPYFNRYKGLLEFKLMSAMGYDAATMGNHEFDIALDGYKRAKQYANFPIITSNYDFSNTILAGETINHLVIQKGPLKIGILAVGVELDGLVPKVCYGETNYQDPIQVANQEASILKKKGCHLVICLSHLGYDYEDKSKVSDLILAKSSRNIDLIIGGHTHTFLEEPVSMTNLDGKKVLINQVGWAGVNLGRLDFYFDKEDLK